MNQNQPSMENITPAVAPVKKTMSRRVIAMIAALVAAALLLSALIVLNYVDFSDSSTSNPSTSGKETFSYRDANIAEFITLRPELVSGLVLPGFESRVDEVTDETVKKYINQQLLSLVAGTDAEVKKKNQVIAYGDEISLYIINVTRNGVPVEVDYFNNAYIETGLVQVGTELFGEDFDAKLIAAGIKPSDTAFETVNHTTLTESSVILLTYTATEKIPAKTEGGEETEKVHANFTGDRIDLAQRAEKDAAWVAKVLENYGVVGQEFSFEHEEDIDEDGENEKLTYTCLINGVVSEEKTAFITATLPEDYFGENPKDEKYAVLNGAELVFEIVIDYSIPHPAVLTFETLTHACITNDFGFFSFDANKNNGICKHGHAAKDFTTDEQSRNQFFSCMKEMLAASYDDTVESAELSVIWEALLDTLEFIKLPELALSEMQDYFRNDGSYGINAIYYNSGSTYDIETYAQMYWGYDTDEYESYEDYIDEYLAPRGVKQQLLMEGIYRYYINDEAELERRFEALVQEIITANTTSEGTPSREVVFNYFGETYLRESVRQEMVSDYLRAKNTVDFTASKEAN